MSRSPCRAVFLDRDGVIIETIVHEGVPRPPKAVEEVVVLPGVFEACQRLHEAGYLNVIVTNQPDVARGVTTMGTVNTINEFLRRLLSIDDVYVCPHDDDDRCSCRKPAPGMLIDAAAEHAIDLERSFMVGDRWRDIEAGRAAGCRTVHVDRSYTHEPAPTANTIVVDLVQAVEWILALDENVVGSEWRELA